VKSNKKRKHFWESKFPIFFIFLRKYISTNKKIRRAVLLLIAFVFIFFTLLLNYSWSPIDRKNLTVTVDIPTGSSFLESVDEGNR